MVLIAVVLRNAGKVLVRRLIVALLLSQERYITDVAERFNMGEARGRQTLMSDIASLIDATGADTDAPYRAAIGCLQYLACCTRPDIMFATNMLGRFSSAPKVEHWTAAKQLIRYIMATKAHKLTYKMAEGIRPIAFSDTDWAGDPTDESQQVD